jgi:capsular exopolysaccharide synthesis family protein
VIRDLRGRETDLVRRQTELESTLGELHPSVQSGRAELANVRQQLQAEVSRIAQSLRNEVEVARSRLRSLEGNLSTLRGSLAASNEAQVRLRELEREATAARTVYERFLERYHEVSDQGRLAPAEARVISAARPPGGPSSPKLSVAALLAFGVAIAFAILLVVFMDVMDDSLHSADDVERKTRTPALVSIPAVDGKALRVSPPNERHPAGYLIERPVSAYAESLRVLRSSILYSALDRDGCVVAITSALPAEGKTTTSLALARTFATAGESVVLVDCDIRRKSLNALLDVMPTVGVMEVLRGDAAFEDVVRRDDLTTAHILPMAASAAFSARDVLGSNAMRKLVEKLRATYDVVLLDCAPVLVVADVRDLVANADTAILVARWGKTSSRAVGAALRQLNSHGGVVLGVALNGVNPRVPGRSSYAEALYYGSVGDGYYQS